MDFDNDLNLYNDSLNPPRGCGKKKHDAFYGEGGGFSSSGALNVWTWLLGDGIDNNVALEIPARQVVAIDPILTVLFKSFMIPTQANIMIPEEAEPLYDKLLTAMKSPGVADHVGANNYTAYEFALETMMYGPSRRIPKRTAKTLAEIISLLGPIPMMFTHSKVPVFKNILHAAEAIKIFHEISDRYYYNRNLYWDPSWTQELWGMYARRNQQPGDDHFMVVVLSMLSDIEQGNMPEKHLAFFKSLAYREQTFGLSWLTRVSYTLPKEGEPEEDIYEIPGLNVIDLDACGELDAILEESNERT